jgi:hypothetical protein
MPYFSTYGVSSPPLLLGYDSLKISDLGWAERLPSINLHNQNNNNNTVDRLAFPTINRNTFRSTYSLQCFEAS